MHIFTKTKIWLYLALGGVVGFWALVTPIFEFPDEQAHFGAVEFLASHGRMAWGSEMDLTPEMEATQKYLGVFRNGMGQNQYTYHPEYRVDYSSSFTGPYEPAIVALNTQDLRSTYVATEAARYPRAYYDYTHFWENLINHQDILTRVFFLRLSSVLLAICMSYIVWQIGYLLFQNKIYATTLTLLVMLQPMMSFLSAGINSDNLHNLLFFVVIYACLKLIHSGITGSSLLLAALATVLDVFTKPQGFIALPIIGLAILMAAIRQKSWTKLIWVFLLSVLVIFLIRSQLSLYLGLLFTDNSRGLSFTEYLHFSTNKLLAQNVVWYWGVFKWLGVVLPRIYWAVANRAVLLSALGMLFYVWRAWRRQKLIIAPIFLIFSLLASAIYALSIYWFDWQYSKTVGYSIGIQARYFFPTLVVHLVILMAGALSLGWNHISRQWLRRGLIVLFFWLQAGGLWTLLSSYYDLSTLAAFITQVSQYKPFFAKGHWWYLWIFIYLSSCAYLAYISIGFRKKNLLRSTYGRKP